MQLLCNCSSYFYKKAVIGRVSWMLLCGKYLLRTTTIAIHLEATVPHGELRAACRSWRGPGEVMFSSSSPWKTTAERGQTNFVSSICLTGSVSQLGKQHTRARTAPLPRTRSKKTFTCKGQTLPAAEEPQHGSLAHCLVMEGSRAGGQGSSTA